MKTIIDKNTGKVLYAVLEVTQLEDNQIAIDELLQDNFIVPYFDLTTRQFYEGASQQEIDDYLKTQVPSEIALWRIRAVLKTLGMEQVVEIALNALPEPTKTGALSIWNYGTAIDRDSQTVLLLQSVLGLTDTQVDDLFIQANNIQL